MGNPWEELGPIAGHFWPWSAGHEDNEGDKIFHFFLPCRPFHFFDRITGFKWIDRMGLESFTTTAPRALRGNEEI
jgi:hypothetical protein